MKIIIFGTNICSKKQKQLFFKDKYYFKDKNLLLWSAVHTGILEELGERQQLPTMLG